jgi:hypothetical protein
MHSAMMLIGYSGDRMAYVAPSIVMFAAFCFMLMRFSKLYFDNLILAVATVLLVLLAGGLGFFEWFDQPAGTRDFDYVFNTGSHTTEWSHPLFHYVFGHRESQMSLCVAVAILYLLAETPGRRELACAGVLAGILPACQHQAFVSFALWMVVYIAIDFLTDKKQIADKLKEFMGFGLFFVIVGFFPLIHYTPRANRAPMLRKDYFWQGLVGQGSYFPKLRLWWDALGVFGVVVLLLCWLGFDKRLIKLYVPGMAVFLLANFYRMQGYSRLNVIAFYPWWMLVASIVFLSFFGTMANRCQTDQPKGVIIGLGVVAFALSICSGTLGYINLRNKQAQVFSPEFESAGKWIAENTPRKAVFITTDAEYDTVIQSAGRVSYWHSQRSGWMYGFDVANKNGDIVALVSRTEDPGILPKVGWVLNQGGRSPDRVLENWALANWSRVYNSGNFTVYRRGGN